MGWPKTNGLFGTAIGRLTPERGNLTSLAEVAILSYYRGSGGEGGGGRGARNLMNQQCFISKH